MPALEIPAADPKLLQDAQQAHLTRLRDRIMQMKALAEHPHSERKEVVNPGEVAAERQLIRVEIAKFEQQLHMALNPPPKNGAAQPSSAVTDVLVAMVDSLKAELAALKAKVFPQAGDGQHVPQPQTPASAA